MLSLCTAYDLTSRNPFQSQHTGYLVTTKSTCTQLVFVGRTIVGIKPVSWYWDQPSLAPVYQVYLSERPALR